MRLLIDTSTVQFRVAGLPKRKISRGRRPSARDGRRPVWTVRLDAVDAEHESKETIWVEVAGDEPKLTFDGYALVRVLVYAPWVGTTARSSAVPRRGGRAGPVRQACRPRERPGHQRNQVPALAVISAGPGGRPSPGPASPDGSP